MVPHLQGACIYGMIFSAYSAFDSKVPLDACALHSGSGMLLFHHLLSGHSNQLRFECGMEQHCRTDRGVPRIII